MSRHAMLHHGHVSHSSTATTGNSTNPELRNPPTQWPSDTNLTCHRFPTNPHKPITTPTPATAQHTQAGGALRLRFHNRPDEAYGCVFDFDSIIANTHGAYVSAWRKLAEARGLPLPRHARLSMHATAPERIIMDVSAPCVVLGGGRRVCFCVFVCRGEFEGSWVVRERKRGRRAYRRGEGCNAAVSGRESWLSGGLGGGLKGPKRVAKRARVKR